MAKFAALIPGVSVCAAVVAAAVLANSLLPIDLVGTALLSLLLGMLLNPLVSRWEFCNPGISWTSRWVLGGRDHPHRRYSEPSPSPAGGQIRLTTDGLYPSHCLRGGISSPAGCFPRSTGSFPVCFQWALRSVVDGSGHSGACDRRRRSGHRLRALGHFHF